MSQDPFDPLPRIDALTKNARTTWFTLLGVILFVGVTLMGVEHIDFYGVDRNTQLPLVNVSVPTDLFFYAAPVLTAAVYIYFHLYLIRLFDELGAANAKVQGKPLGQIVTPWLVTDAALWLRNWQRDDRSAKQRPFEMPSAVFNILLAWGAGLFVLAFAWERSLPARTFAMSSIAALSLWCAVVMGVTSLAAMIDRLTARDENKSHLPVIFIGIVTLAVLADTTYRKTIGADGQIAQLDLSGEEIVERPPGWLPYSIAKSEYRDAWCKRKNLNDCNEIGSKTTEFEADWVARRSTALTDMKRPKWSRNGNSENIRFQNVNFSRSFLAGVDFENADLRNANMNNANLEGIRTYKLKMEGADFSFSHLETSFLFFAKMKNTNLGWAHMDKAILVGAELRDVELGAATMTDVNLSQSRLFGSEERPIELEATLLNGAINKAGAIRHADLTKIVWDNETDFRDAFLDGSVDLPNGFYERMGKPCHWLSGPKKVLLEDIEYLRIWRWWLAKNSPIFLIPGDMLNIPLPTDTRLAELGLTDCEPNQPFGPMPNDTE